MIFLDSETFVDNFDDVSLERILRFWGRTWRMVQRSWLRLRTSNAFCTNGHFSNVWSNEIPVPQNEDFSALVVVKSVIVLFVLGENPVPDPTEHTCLLTVRRDFPDDVMLEVASPDYTEGTGRFHPQVSTIGVKLSLAINVYREGHLYLDLAKEVSKPGQCWRRILLMSPRVRSHTITDRLLKCLNWQGFQLGLILHLSTT